MGTINSIENDKIKQILEYYLFHKKIKYIFKDSSNPLIDHKKQNVLKIPTMNNLKKVFLLLIING